MISSRSDGSIPISLDVPDEWMMSNIIQSGLIASEDAARFKQPKRPVKQCRSLMNRQLTASSQLQLARQIKHEVVGHSLESVVKYCGNSSSGTDSGDSDANQPFNVP